MIASQYKDLKPLMRRWVASEATLSRMENLHCKRKNLKFWTVRGIHMRNMKLSYIIKPFKNIKICYQYVVLDNKGVLAGFPNMSFIISSIQLEL